MITLITLSYCLCVWLVFSKLKLVKPTARTLGAAVAVGVIIVGGIIIGWQFSAPFSKQLITTQYVVQITPQVKGLVTKVHAKIDVPLKKGDVLFEVDPAPFQDSVDQLTAAIEAAKKKVQQLEAGVAAAKASVTQAGANQHAAKAQLDVAQDIQKLNPDAISKINVVQVTEQYHAATAALDQAKKSVPAAEFALESGKAGVENVKAQRRTAEFNLNLCSVRAPSDGIVVDWQVREGSMTARLRSAALGTFIDTSTVNLIAIFPQNVLKNVKAGDAVDIALKNRPGEIAIGKVDTIIQATGEGQLQPTGILPSAASLDPQGKFAVKILLDKPIPTGDIGMGTAGAAAIYTDKGQPFHLISKIVVRIQAWKNYLPF